MAGLPSATAAGPSSLALGRLNEGTAPACQRPRDRGSAEALARAARSGLPYVLVPADPLGAVAAVAAQWQASWDVSGAAEGTAGFEVQAGLALAAWRAGRFELPDYYLEIAPAETGEATETGQAGPDLYLAHSVGRVRTGWPWSPPRTALSWPPASCRPSARCPASVPG